MSDNKFVSVPVDLLNSLLWSVNGCCYLGKDEEEKIVDELRALISAAPSVDAKQTQATAQPDRERCGHCGHLHRTEDCVWEKNAENAEKIAEKPEGKVDQEDEVTQLLVQHFKSGQPNMVDFHNGDAAMWVEDGEVKSEWYNKAEQHVSIIGEGNKVEQQAKPDAELTAWLYEFVRMYESTLRNYYCDGRPVGKWISERVMARTMTPAVVAHPPAQPQQLTDELCEAVANLIKVKGRYHTEQAYQRLVKAYDAAMAAQGKDGVA
jgi:hypothetical protein